MNNIAKSSLEITKFCHIIQELFDFSKMLESIENRITHKYKFETTQIWKSRFETTVTWKTQLEAIWNILLEIVDNSKDRDSRTQAKAILLKYIFKNIFAQHQFGVKFMTTYDTFLTTQISK